LKSRFTGFILFSVLILIELNSELSLILQNYRIIIIATLLVIGIIINIEKIKSIFKKIYLLYTGLLILVSSFYAPDTYYSIQSALFYLLLFVFITLAYSKSWSSLIRVYTLFTLIFLSASIIASILYPELTSQTQLILGGEIGRFKGLSVHSNSLGRIAAFGFVIALIAYKRGYVTISQLSIITALSLLAIYLSNSRTSLLVVVYSILVYYYINIYERKKMNAIPQLFVITIFVILAMLFFFIDNIAIFTRSGDANEIFTLTGRTFLWQHLFQEANAHMIFGAGHAATHIIIQDTFIGYNWTTSHAHNMFIQVYFCYGIVGLIVLMYINFKVLTLSTIQFILITTLLFAGLSESVIFNISPNITTVVWIIALLYEN
jgi:O-antigen ligase